MKLRFCLRVVELYNFMVAHAQDVYETILEPTETPEYPYEPTPYCADEVPEPQPFEVSFSTTWGTLPGNGVGEVDLIEVPGIDAHAYSAAASKTFVPTLPGLGNVTIYISGTKFRDPTIHGFNINMSPYKFLSGEDIIFNNVALPAFTYRMPSLLDPTNIKFMGIVTNGILRLDEAGMNPGDAVSGTFSGEMIVFPPDYLE